MRKGMFHYLGGHKTYNAKLLDITYGVNAVVIKYGEAATYVNPQGETVEVNSFWPPNSEHSNISLPPHSAASHHFSDGVVFGCSSQ